VSWDRFLLPYPFGQGLFLWGKPIWVSPAATEADLESKRVELEEALNRITAEADDAMARSN
jgi:lysophospholipid acyltransferase (LPLAT)-like uncharacterized protein